MKHSMKGSSRAYRWNWRAAYAQAYALAATAYADLGAAGQLLPEQAFRIVKQSADKASELEPTVSGGPIAGARSLLDYTGGGEAAVQSGREARRW